MRLISIKIVCPSDVSGEIMDTISNLLSSGKSLQVSVSDPDDETNSRKEEFKKNRRSLKLSQEEFGRKLGNVSQAFISDLEVGKSKIPDDLLEASRDLIKREESKIRK